VLVISLPNCDYHQRSIFVVVASYSWIVHLAASGLSDDTGSRSDWC